jgi:cellulose synthase/poly-beta-1,6-N-acetylglucosamine synthase-like glycosyltransferase
MLIGCAFFVLMLLCSIGLFLRNATQNHEHPGVSICIACRNEAENLPALFAALDALHYPTYEVIIVDDGSTDASPQLLDEFCSARPHASWYQLTDKPADAQGKRYALALAIDHATYPLIALTDADCTPPANWLKEAVKHITPQVGMVTGPVVEEPHTTFSRLVYTANSAIYAATCGLGIPFSCAGGNILLRTAAYDATGGFHHFHRGVAGDDKQLLQAIKKTGWDIVFNPAEAVKTIPSTKQSRPSQLTRRYGKFHLSSLPFQLLQVAIGAFLIWVPVSAALGIFIPVFCYVTGVWMLWGCALLHLHRRVHITDILLVPLFPYLMIWFTLRGLIKPRVWHP